MAPPPGLGAVTSDHVVPFHRIVSRFDPGPWFPTATQLVVLTHETPCRKPLTVVVSSDQVAPFHVSMGSPFVPTAKHRVVLGHDTSLSAPSCWLSTIDHDVPFHRSINEWNDPVPTAKQLVAPVHATPDNSLDCEDSGFGDGTTDHDVPFHCWISVNLSSVPVEYVPTAKQLVTDRHVTSCSSALNAPGGLGLVTIDQLVPFHRSISARLPFRKAPTAKQSVALTHETPCRFASGDPLGSVVGTIDQLPATLRSISVRVPLSDDPTAVQSAAHTTDHNTLAPDRLGLASIDQVLPFQRATIVWFACEPTATQFCGALHDTPKNWFGPPPLGVGDETTDHDEPFHFSIKV